MQRKFLQALLCAAALALTTPGASRAQVTPAADQGEVPEVNYRLKKVSLSLYGGLFSGGAFLELPAPGDRTQEAEGASIVYSYDGTPFTTLDPDFYSAPEKKIESGPIIGGQIGFYLSEDFHLDLQMAVASSKATTTFLFDDPKTIETDPVRVLVDEDPAFKSLMGGAGLAYDARNLSFFGVTPYFGCAFGGVINRFTHLEDKTALYFQVSGGFYHDLAQKLRVAAQFSATTFSFEREELVYTKQVTYGTAALSLTYLVDMIPGD